MKQLTLDTIIDGLSDAPISIGDRLTTLGVEENTLSTFSKELLETVVYGSSFLKFLQENRDKLGINGEIPAEALPEDFKDAFEEGEATLENRLVAAGFPKEDLSAIFGEDTLQLSLSAQEFTAFIEKNPDKFLAGIKNLAGVGATDA
ncbi:MAG: hypothetical protein AAB512_04160 [Patescibacteria group bacterium]